MSNKYSKFKKQNASSFQDNYPRARRNRYRRRYSRSAKVRRVKQSIAAACGFLLLIGLGFFIASTFMDISKKPVPVTTLPTEQTVQSSEKATEAPKPAKQSPVTAAIYLPEKISRNPSQLNSFLDNAQKIGATAVVITVKREDGTLAYQSQTESAKRTASVKDAVDIPAIIKTIQSKNIKVIAHIQCFRDPLASYRLSKQAYVHYKNTDTPWVDNAPDKGGKRWMNPYSEEAQNYLLEIISEVSAMGVDEIFLDSVQFPSGFGLSSATYPGESESGKSRNQILKIFISKASRSAGAVPLCVNVTANSALNGDEKLYGGSLLDSKDALFSPDFRLSKLPSTVSVNGENASPKANPADFIAKASQQLKGSSAQLMPVLEPSPTLSEQVKALNSAGINSYIVYSESGNYAKIK